MIPETIPALQNPAVGGNPVLVADLGSMLLKSGSLHPQRDCQNRPTPEARTAARRLRRETWAWGMGHGHGLGHGAGGST